jgi:hypothetical protein
MSMSRTLREELLPRFRQRYLSRNKEGKGRLIDELCEQFGYSRKHAIKLLGAKSGWGGNPEVRKGRPVVYDEEDRAVLLKIWKAAEQPCGKRLVALLPQWLPYYEAENGKLPKQRLIRLGKISAAQVDRLLARHKVGLHRGRCGTKPGGLLKNQIPIRTDNWDITQPGFLEADTVAHCGGSLEGSFVWSVTFTDIYSGWTANRAVWNKGAAGIVAATRDVEEKLPFAILGFDCDNGSEFLNHHLVKYFLNRKTPVGFTRSRPYHKDDNGHVEQKNWTHVRQLLAYHRIEDPELIDQINIVYRDIWEPFHNFFSPSAKLIKKTRIGAKIKRRHDRPMTPCDRLLGSSDISNKVKRHLRAVRAQLNPFELQRRLNEALAPILQRSARQPRESSTESLSNEISNGTPAGLTTVS